MARSDTGVGNVWFKIFRQGKTQESSNFNNVKWASPDTLLQNSGRFYFDIPSDLAPGNYLLRTEIIAMHDVSYHGSQPYVRCVELTVTGAGTANPPGVSIPGTYDYNHAGITYNIYNNYQQAYPFFGLAVYVPGSAPSSTTAVGGVVTTGQAVVTTSAATTAANEPRINVRVTVALQMAPDVLELAIFVYELTQVLRIPSSALSDITVLLDDSTATETHVQFTIWNDFYLGGGRVDPIAVAQQLQTMADSDDPRLHTATLTGMRVLGIDDGGVESSPESFMESMYFVITIAVVAGVVLIVIVVVIGVVVAKKKKAAAFY